MPNEIGIQRSDILNKLNLSLHGDLAAYQGVIGAACKQDPEFTAHLISFDFTNGQIKDSKIALPVITLATREFPDELVENSLAHLAMQSPRELLRAFRFSMTLNLARRRDTAMKRLIHTYLDNRATEPGKWNRLAARHRRSLKSLYALTHAKIPAWAADVLFNGNPATGTIFSDIKNLSKMSPAQAAATIQKWHLSPLVVSGAMTGAKAAQQDSAVVQAGMDQMSDTEVVTRAKSLEKKGLSRDSALKDTFRKKVAKATTSKKATLKTSIAADEVEDEGIKTMLRELQERQIQAQKDAGRGIDGNWLILVDRSGSQAKSIELGSHIAAAVTKFVSGKVWLVFQNTDVTPIDVTGKTLEQIQGQTKFIYAGGGTSYGVGLKWAMEKKLDIDGIALIGDGGENNSPYFHSLYGDFEKKLGKQPPVYFYITAGEPNVFSRYMKNAGFTTTDFDLTSGRVDYFSIPNLVQSMNVSRFGVVEKVMACPLVTLDQVFNRVAVAA